MVKLNNKTVEFNIHGNPILNDDNVKVKVPAGVYDRNAHRRFLRAKLREEKRKEEERIEREEKEAELQRIRKHREYNIETLFNMHDLDRKVFCKTMLDSLDPIMQFVMYRRYYQNQSLSSIAEEIGRSSTRVMQIESKAKRLIQYRLQSGIL